MCRFCFFLAIFHNFDKKVVYAKFDAQSLNIYMCHSLENFLTNTYTL